LAHLVVVNLTYLGGLPIRQVNRLTHCHLRHGVAHDRKLGAGGIDQAEATGHDQPDRA
jgi:hypothetical protein